MLVAVLILSGVSTFLSLRIGFVAVSCSEASRQRDSLASENDRLRRDALYRAYLIDEIRADIGDDRYHRACERVKYPGKGV